MVIARSATTVRCYRCTSWFKKAADCIKSDPDDLDAAFVFCWIAFNALYGQPIYLKKQDERQGQGDWNDILKFLGLMTKYGRVSVESAMRKAQEDIQKIQDNQFLCKQCWVRWNENKLFSKEQRLSELCRERSRDNLRDLFHRLYVLRNQIFHGCSSDRSAKNRESIAPAVTVMRALVPVFREIVRHHGYREDFLRTLSYPPSATVSSNQEGGA